MRRRPLMGMQEKARWRRLLDRCTAIGWLPFRLRYWASSTIVQFMRKLSAKPPKPMRRKRALSICSHDDSSKLRKPQLTAEQTQCGFFKLPIELRTAIYEEVVGRDAIHIILLGGRLCSYRHLSTEVYAKVHELHMIVAWSADIDCEIYTGTFIEKPGIGVLGSLQSCRRLYTEMISTVYSSPQFLFSEPSSILAFVATILPRRFNTIRSVYIDQRYGGREWPLPFFNSTLDYKSIRHLNIVASPFPNSSRKPEKMRLFRLVCEIFCEMNALKELRLDFDYLKLQNLGDNDYDKSMVQDVNQVLAMLERRKFKTLEVNFERVPSETAGLIDRPFVRFDLQPMY